MTDPAPPPATTVRRLVRSASRVALATVMRGGDGGPYASLALVAWDHDASPLLLLSDLADHSRNLAADARVALLLDGTAGHEDPLAGPRATLLGQALASDDARHRARYLARHPQAAQYAGFRDFRIYRVEVERAHLVAGFGRIRWLEGREVLLPAEALGDLPVREAELIEELNREHLDAVQLYAERLLGLGGGGWIVTGVDPEGLDLRREAQTARLAFERPVVGVEDARATLVALARRARIQEGAATAEPAIDSRGERP